MAAIALTPSAPVLVPELAGAATAEVTEFREAAIAAAATLPDRWIAIGVGLVDRVIGPSSRGTFAGYGVDVPVALSPDVPTPVSGTPAQLPLCALFTGWLRELGNPRARAEVRVYAADHDVASALSIGRQLRAEIDEADGPVGVLVVADGANTLTPAAPGGYDPSADPSAESVQTALDDALATGDAPALTRLPATIIGRVAYQVLAGLVEPEPHSARELARGAPYGVGYFVGLWHP